MLGKVLALHFDFEKGKAHKKLHENWCQEQEDRVGRTLAATKNIFVCLHFHMHSHPSTNFHK